MAVRKADADLDFGAVGKIIRALLNPVSSDPGSPVAGEVWFNTTDARLKIHTASGTESVAWLDDVTSGSITGALWNAQSVVVAVTDDTPIPQTLAASTVLGRRATGDITAVSFANLLTDLQALGINASQLNGQTSAYHLSRANHTGSQASSTISDFNSAVDARAQAIVNAVIDAAPTALDTLNELAAALGDDANFATTMNTALGLRTRKYANNYGNGSLQTFTVNHALGTTDVIAQARLNSNGQVVDCVFDVVDANNIEAAFNTVYAAAAVRVVVIG